MFSSITFIYIFLPLTIIFYYIHPNIKYKNVVLLIFSLLFYSTEKAFLFLMLGSILITYINGLLIQKTKNKIVFILAIAIAILPLLYYKYTNFLFININSLFGTSFNIKEIILPLGISFYTFQIITYLVDVKRENIAERNILNLALYISFFPQLVAGPIVKYSHMKNQLLERKHSLDLFYSGILYFILGLMRKVLIANQLGEICNNFNLNNTTILMTWIYMVCYTMQVYFDFSGYSAMAIGLGKMFGIILPKNFNYPLLSFSIKDFWKKWHMTLSSFFKDYVYIPLGGSRCSIVKNIFNLFVVWTLTGFWHGANWNFICWGLYFFLLLVIEKYLIKDKIPKLLNAIITVFLVNISFLLFGADSISSALNTIKSLFVGTPYDVQSLYLVKNYFVLIIISLIFSTPIFRNIYTKIKDRKYMVFFETVFILFGLLVSTAYLIDGSFNPFLYFRF